jgi:hypothetical protein
MAGMSRVVTVAIVLAVIAACSLILLHVFRGHGQTGTVIYSGRTYDCRQVLDSSRAQQALASTRNQSSTPASATPSRSSPRGVQPDAVQNA